MQYQVRRLQERRGRFSTAARWRHRRLPRSLYTGQSIEDAFFTSPTPSTWALVSRFLNLRGPRKPAHPLRVEKFRHDGSRGHTFTAPGYSDYDQHGSYAQTAVGPGSGAVRHGSVAFEAAGKTGNANEPKKKRKRPSKRGEKKRETNSDETGQCEKLLWACPYYKFDPQTYDRCAGKYELRKPSDVKQHLSRRHMLDDIHCPICWDCWDSHELCLDHIFNRSCLPQPGPEPLLQGEFDAIKTFPPGLSPYEQWYWMWELLFVGHPPPESPYVEARGVESTKVVLRQAEPALRHRLPQLLVRTSPPGEGGVTTLIDGILQILSEAAHAPHPTRSRRQNLPRPDPQRHDYGRLEISGPQLNSSLAMNLNSARSFAAAISGPPESAAFSGGGNHAPTPNHANTQLNTAAEDANYFLSPPGLVPAWTELSGPTPWDEVDGGNSGPVARGQTDCRPEMWADEMHNGFSLEMDTDAVMAEPDIGDKSEAEFALDIMPTADEPMYRGEDDFQAPPFPPSTPMNPLP